MPNYLARVAAAGARTSTAIRPPVSAPPVMPASGLFEPTWSAEVEAENVPPAATETGRLLDVQLTPMAPAFEAAPVSAPIPELPLGETPPVPPSAASSASPAVTRPVEGLAALPHAAAPASPRTEVRREIEHPIIDEVIRVPRSLRPTPIPETLSATAGAAHSENLPADAPVRPSAPLPAVHERTAEPMPAAVRQRLAPAERLSDLAIVVETPPGTPAAVAPRPDAPPLLGGLPSLTAPTPVEVPAIATAVPERRHYPEVAGLPQPPAQPGPPAPPAAAQRQSRITIGRLEVQVANHPPLPTAQSARLPGPPDRDILAGLYLDRFRLMP